MPTSRKIIIEFDGELLGEVSGREGAPYGFKYKNHSTRKHYTLATANNSGDGAASSALDGATGTIWGTRTSLPNWWRVDLALPRRVDRLLVFGHSSFSPNAFILQGSNDLAAWTDIFSGNMTNGAVWNTYDFEGAGFRYWQIWITSSHGARRYIGEVELLEKIPIGNESAFSVTGMQRNPLRIGSLAQKPYPVDSVERWPGSLEGRFLQLNFDPVERFNNVEGQLTVAYDQDIGNLKGLRSVLSFSRTFLPTGMAPTPVPINEERISAEVNILSLTFTPLTFYLVAPAGTTGHVGRIDHKYCVPEEKLLAAVFGLSLTFIHINDLNP